ncbi:MAG TPA: UxaA family hydrolase [Smithella sp.]|nr:UxaA family hydrolase [Smithella sp.]
MDNILVVHPRDNVGIALKTIAAGEPVIAQGKELFCALEEIPVSHKVALADIAPDEEIIKYGEPIAVSTQPIQKGRWVHTHNLASGAWKR